MADSGANVLVFAVREKNNPQHDRALLLYYSVMREKVLRWKMCKVTYTPKGADVDPKNPPFKGSANHNGSKCNLITEKGGDFGTITFLKPIAKMKGAEERKKQAQPPDLADYQHGSNYYPIEFITKLPGEFFEAFLPQMMAVA